MAEEQIVTRIVATSDFSNLIADLGKVSSALTNLQTKLNATNKNLAAQAAVMNRSFAETLRSTGQYSSHFVNLTSDVDKFGSQLDKGQIKLKQFFQVYQGHLKTNGGLIRQLAQQQVQLQNAILQPLGKNAEGLMQYNVHIPAGLDKVKSKTALARQELQIMNRVVQEGANSLINWGKNTQWAGRQLTVGLTVPLAAFGAASAKAFREADQELTRLTKVYGGLAATSAKDLARVRQDVTETASELSKAYGSSFKETLALGADIAATGKQGNELLGSIRETTRLAVLGEVDRADAMKATLAIQSAFKSNTDELAESINFLNAVENQTSTTLNDLVEAIPKAGPIVKGLGGDVQDLALYLTAMREGGISASEGANALKSGLASLINPTKVAKEMFNGFGISLTDIVQKNAGDTTATILALQSALDTLNPLQKQQALEQLFGKFQFARMNALFENLGKQGSQTLQVMDLMKASSEELANIAGRELSMVTESASGKYRRALEGLKADLAGVGEQFLTINTHLINIVSGILKFIDKLPGPIKTILAFFGGLTAVAGPLIMLTGVLANFFGYVIKGASHFRSMFKGGEGWRLLTPEILAANKAGSLVEQTFYSDAKAAEILKTAVDRLSASYQKLAADANNAIISTNPGVSTVGGTSIIAGRRVVNPKSPYLGPEGSRSAGHHISRSTMSGSQRDSQTIHSFTPIPLPLNQKVGTLPMVFAEGDLPKIEGLTASKGVSTGIVAGEAAKWHALMGTLSMMTKREVGDLKKEIARTGTFSTEINSTFGQLLPAMTNLTRNAAAESALIVQQLQAGKITVDAARAKIIAINAQLETMMAQTTTQVAADLGRTANLTQVPLINQPIVGPTGKANIKEIFRAKRPGAQIIDKIARGLGVRTWGGGYSTETTMPKRFATGGRVFGGPRSDTTDTQFEYLPEGAFVLNRKASDNLLGFNQGGMVPAMVTPGEILIENPTPNEVTMLEAYNNKFAAGGRVINSKNNYGIPTTSLLKLLSASQMKKLVPGFSGGQRYYQAKGTAGVFIGDISDPKILKKYPHLVNKNGVISRTTINSLGTNYKIPGELFKAAIKARPKGVNLGSADNFLDTLAKNGVLDPKQAKNIRDAIEAKYFDYLSKNKVWDTNNNYWKIVNSILSKELVGNSNAKSLWKQYSSTVAVHTGSNQAKGGKSGASTSPQTIKIRDKSGKVINFGTLEGDLKQGYLFAHTKTPDPLRKVAMERLNRGGVVGGRVRRGKNNYGIPGLNTSGLNQPPLIEQMGLQSPTQMQPDEQMPKQRGMLTGSLIGMAGSMGGYSLGSKFGGQLGGFAGMMLVPALLDKVISKMGALGKTSTGTASILGRLGPILTNPYVAFGAAIVGATAVLLKLNAKIEETRRINRLAFSGGVKPIKDFDSELKQVKENIENTRAASELLHAQMNSAGLSGLNITIKEFADLREKIKSTHPELIKLFNQTPNDKLSKVVEGLKAQFVAAGDSAAQANAKIAALMAETGKTGFIQSVLGSEGVKGIVDAKTAISSMLKALEGFMTSKDKAAGILQIFSSMSDYIATSNDKGAALKEQFDLIAKSGQANVQITQDQIVELSKTDPVLAGILDRTDTVGKALAKWRLAVAGVNKELDGSEAELIKYAIAAEGIDSYYKKLLDVSSKEAQSNKMTGQWAKDIDAFEKKQVNASKTAIQNLEKQIDLKNKQIDQIKKEADARKKALRDQQQIEDVRLQIQQEQLSYQSALAAGDMSSAAQAQINIQRLVGQQQLKTAEDAIDSAAQAKIDALQAQIDVLNKKSTAVSNAASTAKPAQSPSRSTYEGVQSVYKQYSLGNIDEATAASQLNDLVKKLEQTKGGDKYIKDLGLSKSADNFVREDGRTTKVNLDLTSGVGLELRNALNKGTDNLVKAAIDKSNTYLQDIRNKLVNDTDPAPVSTGGGAGARSGRPGATDNTPNSGWGGYADAVNKKPGRLYTPPGASRYIMDSAGNAVYENLNPKEFKDIARYYNTKLAMGGYIRNYDMGSIGGVKGPGTGTSDSIPAWLSNGEYVIKEKAVRQYGVSFFDKLNAQKFAQGGTVSPNPNKAPIEKPEILNLNGEFFRVNNSNINKIIEEMRAIFATEPKVEKFTDRVDYYKAYDAWVASNKFVIPPLKSYPEKGQEYPMGSLKRFLAVAESQSGKEDGWGFRGYDFADHGYKLFNPATSIQAKLALNSKSAKPKEVLSYLESLSGTNKFSIDLNKKYKLGSDVLAWCGAYIAWVAEKSGVDISKNMFSAYKATKEYKDSGEFKDVSNKSFAPGDIVWWDWANRHPKNSPDYKSNTPGTPDHVDIITKKFKGLEFELIGGGLGSSVGKRKIDFGDEEQSKALYGSVTPRFIDPSMEIPKFHTLNGPVPGPYGKEVSAILKAGTEGVYQEPYIKSLKNNQNGTMGNVFNFSNTVNAAEGQDANQIADVVLRKFIKFTKDANTKIGPSRVIS